MLWSNHSEGHKGGAATYLLRVTACGHSFSPTGPTRFSERITTENQLAPFNKIHGVILQILLASSTWLSSCLGASTQILPEFRRVYWWETSLHLNEHCANGLNEHIMLHCKQEYRSLVSTSFPDPTNATRSTSHPYMFHRALHLH